jgi:hypothetical protein
MNEKRTPSTRQTLVASLWKTPVLLAISASLAAIFWIASVPVARAATITPAEMIQANLPHSQSLASAPKAAVLSAICKAVSKNQKEAPEIVRTAAGARKELTADILQAVVNCLQENRVKLDCTLARSTLQQAIAANGDQADSLTELFIQLSPTCVESPEEGPNINFSNVSNINPAPGSVAAGSGTSHETCSVCHNNHSIQVACSNLENYLSHHPGDTAGRCEATPDTNR